MNAFYFIDKPIWITSFDVVKNLRKILNIKRLWHTWTLDPLASGGLLIATWNYTKLIPYFEKDFKTYEFEVSFNWTSPSFDLGTEVNFITDKDLEKLKQNLTTKNLENILKEKFSWEIEQIPPKYSALKINWKKALNKVLDWEEFELKPRKCFIYEIKLINLNFPKATFIAKVSAWTYIRSIANDLWQYFWSWAYVSKLRRISVWELEISNSQKLENFDKEKKLSIKKLFKSKIFVEKKDLNDEILKKLNNWMEISWDFPFEKNKDIFIVDWENVLNIAIFDWKKLIPRKKI